MSQNLPEVTPHKMAVKRRQAWIVLTISGIMLVLALALTLVIPIWQMQTAFAGASSSGSVNADGISTQISVAMITVPYGLLLGVLAMGGAIYATVGLLKTDKPG